MSATNLLNLSDEIIDLIVNYSCISEAIDHRQFVPKRGPTNLFIILSRKAGLVSLSSSCIRLRRLSTPALFNEVYLSRDNEQWGLLDRWTMRKADTSPVVLKAIRYAISYRFRLFSQ